ncbi:hypothetical protein KI387_016647, partial [Taxus chinensis]
FNWDDVKADKYRENYLGHSLKAPVGRWQKGKDLFWYTRDNKGGVSSSQAEKDEIKRIKEEEEHSMREILGLAPKRENRPQGNRLDKRETAELLKKGTSAEDFVPGYADGERVQGLGFTRAPHHSVTEKVISKEIQHASNDKSLEREKEFIGKSQRDEINPQYAEHESHSDRDDQESKKMKRKEEKERKREEKKALKQDKRNHEPDSRRDKRRHESDLNRKQKKRRHDSDSSD